MDGLDEYEGKIRSTLNLTGSGCRKMEGERAAFTEGALDADFAAVGQRDMLCDSQTQTGSALSPTAGLINPIKTFEQTR